jgi:hypothetical protein
MKIDHPTRTEQQHKARWKYLSLLADELMGKGISQRVFLEKLQGYDVPITKEFLAEVWKEIQQQMFGTNSSKHLKTDQVSQVYDVMNLFTSTEWGVGMDFPHE